MLGFSGPRSPSGTLKRAIIGTPRAGPASVRNTRPTSGSASPSAYYGISLDNVGNTGYDALAVAASGKSQASDSGCQVMAVRMADGNLLYGSATSAAGLDWTATNPDPQRCWAR